MLRFFRKGVIQLLFGPPNIERTVANNLKVSAPLGVPRNDLAGKVPFEAPLRPTAIIAEEQALRNQILWEQVIAAIELVQLDQPLSAEQRPKEACIRRAEEAIEGQVQLPENRCCGSPSAASARRMSASVQGAPKRWPGNIARTSSGASHHSPHRPP